MDDPMYMLMKERTAQLRREAALERLARVARVAACCPPSLWRRARTALLERVRGRTQLCCA